ncbi:MAG: amidohydrolase [Cyclobacteriaceae bacterium]|nr:amidohydrolase [Cyclobacteriaceae bacterium]MCB0500856.1 amidohydrolase [Cyclobacteriaceae bacterium]MCB9238437.1 amidohydrolase [Flammeovirgaceae bacterium]MCO5271268.1 amidohydrolase [Cyclobacteriaceae bacterium]MCW5903870.1 amidohydrolase [Cyclobacteriaceae bacterium]
MKTITATLLFFASLTAFAQYEKEKKVVTDNLDKNFSRYTEVAKEIWDYAELGFLEDKSTAALQGLLAQEGFKIDKGVAGMPTAFVATYGSGKPVIGILAEFDALPGLSQQAQPTKSPVAEGGSGHGCGHNLFGTASSASAIALKTWLAQSKRPGTVKLYGTPAEEGGAAKVYMARAGLLEGVDAVINWHPSSQNNASAQTCLAVIQGMFRFYGVSAHAAAAPDRGRSALDGVEAMDYMVNMMREHVPQESRIHYVIKKGGEVPNVVPDYAEVEYIVRSPKVEDVKNLWARVVKAAEAGAMGTETNVKVEIISGIYNLLPNETLAKLQYENLKKVGGVNYTPEEEAFAKKMQESFNFKAPPISEAQKVQEYKVGFFPASTDVGDISWLVPTAGLGTATAVPGTPGHSWQNVACSGMSIGFKGMINAAKVMAMTGVDLFMDPSLIAKAKGEFEAKRGKDFKYESLIGDREPPLDFRKSK